MSPAASLLLGALLGAANAAAALWSARRATALAPNRALAFVLGGMAARMGLTLAAIALVLVLVPLHRGAFVGGLGVLFVAGLVAECALVLGRPAAPDA
jgi:hypothetical protein